MIAPALLLTLAPIAAPSPQIEALSPGPPRPGARSEGVKRVRKRIQLVLEQLVEGSVPGASAALVLPDGQVLTFVAGLASLESGERLTVEHRLLVGSSGKTFVAAAVQRLAQEDGLDLDARAASCFDETPTWLEELPNGREFTIHQLLRHESGLPRYVFKEEFSGTLAVDPERVWRPQELLAFVSDDSPLFAPGEGWAYSDTNYIVLGLVIEELAQTSFYDYAREHFVERFQLADTVASDRLEIPRMAQGHVVMGRAMGIPERTLQGGAFVYNVQFEWCGGGWASTPRDLARWARILYAGDALEEPYLDSLLDAVPAQGLGPGARYGMGAILRDTPAGTAIGHDGFMPGYLTSLAWFPDRQVGAALQLNCDDGAAVGRPLALVLAELAQIVREELGE